MNLGEFIDYFKPEYFSKVHFINDKYCFSHEKKEIIEISKDNLFDLTRGGVASIKEILNKPNGQIYDLPYENSLYKTYENGLYKSLINATFKTEKGGYVSIYCFDFYEISEILEIIDPLIEKYQIKNLLISNSGTISEPNYMVSLNGNHLSSCKLKDISKEIEGLFKKKDKEIGI